MITAELVGQVQVLGRRALESSRLPADLAQVCVTALERPGRLLGGTPISTSLFFAWSEALAPAVPSTWTPVAVACEYVLAGCDLIDRHTDDLFSQQNGEWVREVQQSSLAAGTSLLVQAEELLGEIAVPQSRQVAVIRALSQIIRRALAAHDQDHLLRTQPTARPEELVAVLLHRSGELVALPCVCAALLAGANLREVALARRFGRALGCACQLEDDLADREEDIHTRRKTLPLLLTQSAAGEAAVATAACAVLIHRFLEEAADALRRLDPLYNGDALWAFLPNSMRASSRSLQA